MKTILLVIVLLVSGCAFAPTAEPETTDTLVPTVSVDDEYLAAVRDAAPVLNGVDDSTLLDNAELTCGLLDEGYSIYDIFEVAFDSGVDPETAGTLAGGAVAFYCPEHEDAFNN